MLHFLQSLLVVAVIASAAAGVAQSSTQAGAQPAYLDPTQPLDRRVDNLVSRLTLAEKLAQMRLDAPPIARLGVPAFQWVTDCVHGVNAGVPTTVFPQVIGMAATWDEELQRRVGEAISDEARALYHNGAVVAGRKAEGIVLVGPQVNIFRDPRWARGQETFGEDPCLASRLAASYIRGLQGDDARCLKTLPVVKHFAVFSGPEYMIDRMDIHPSKRDLWETYLPAFEAAVRLGNARGIATSPNMIYEVPGPAQAMLLDGILRGQWGYDGFVASYWNGVANMMSKHRVVDSEEEAASKAVKAGCDLAYGEGFGELQTAIDDRLLDEASVTKAVRRLFAARFRLGEFDPPDTVPYASIPASVVDCPEHRRLAMNVARRSMVLLKNESVLPLARDIGSVALIGPTASDSAILLGTWPGKTSEAASIAGGIVRAAGPSTRILNAEGYPGAKSRLKTIAPQYFRPPSGQAGSQGLRAEYFNNRNLEGNPEIVGTSPNIDFTWGREAPLKGINPEPFSIRWTGRLLSPTSGPVVMAVTSDDGSRVFVDGKQVLDDWVDHSARMTTFSVQLEAGREHDIRVEYFDMSAEALVILQWDAESTEEVLREEAVETARRADAAVVVTGFHPGRDTERLGIELDPAQQELVAAVTGTGKPVVVVNLSGGPVLFGKALAAGAIVQAWYPGEEGGTAVADVLFGNTSPGGRLPVSFPKSTAALPPLTDYDMSHGRTYRYAREPAEFAFGHGLGYTTFEYSGLRLEPATVVPGGVTTASVTVANTGRVAGDEVVQLYVRHGGGEGPHHSLKAFRRVTLQPGQRQDVSFGLGDAELHRVKTDGRRVVEAGDVTLFVGGAQPPLPGAAQDQAGKVLSATLKIEGKAKAVEALY